LFEKLLSEFNSVFWVPIYILLFIIGFSFSIRTNFLQFRKFFYVISHTLGKAFKKSKSKEGAISSWQAVTTALGSTIGTGNIVGVTTAIVCGGPGAVFWMWFIAAFGMITKYAEVVLAIKFREKNKDGEWSGGPMYYIKKGLNWKFLAGLMAFLLSLAAITSGCLTQINSIATSLYDAMKLPRLATAIIFVIIIGLVIIGGVKRIGAFAEKIVPFMGVLYILGSLVVLIANYQNIPEAFASIFQDAFKLKSTAGGFAGYGIASAVHYGIARGTASSEAGLGSAPVVHAAADVSHPVKQGFYGILEVFVSSFIICTSTALVVLTAGIYDKNIYNKVLLSDGIAGLNSLNDAVAVISKSFSSVLGNSLGTIFLVSSIIFFSITTIIGWSYYGATSIEFLWNKKAAFIYKIIFLCFIIVGAFLNINIIWELSDITNGFMTIINIIALIGLSSTVIMLTKDFFNKRA